MRFSDCSGGFARCTFSQSAVAAVGDSGAGFCFILVTLPFFWALILADRGRGRNRRAQAMGSAMLLPTAVVLMVFDAVVTLVGFWSWVEDSHVPSVSAK